MGREGRQNGGFRAAVIREVQTPLGFFALIVLVAEAILGFLASKASGLDFTLLVGGMIFILLLLIVTVAFLAHKSPARLGYGTPSLPAAKTIRHDVFISSPMAGFEDDMKYRQDRQNVLRILDSLRKECKFTSLVYAGRDVRSMEDFDAADLSVKDDFLALEESKYFVLLYPEKMLSSVLFEAGAALALRKPSLYFVRDRDDLPFLMKQAEMAFPVVKIYEYSSADDIVKLIEKHGEKLFPPAESG